MNVAGYLVETMESQIIFCTPISIYKLPILDSQPSPFHNYRIWSWAGLLAQALWGWAGQGPKACKTQAQGPLQISDSFKIWAPKIWPSWH
jgi:hypothetical protein